MIVFFFDLPSICWRSIWENVGLRGMLGDLHLGGVEHVSTNSSLSMVRGTIAPTKSLSVEPSSMPRPSQRPHGNLNMCPVTSLRTTTCSTIHFGDMPVLSWPIRSVDSTPRFLCWKSKVDVRSLIYILRVIRFITASQSWKAFSLNLNYTFNVHSKILLMWNFFAELGI